MEKTATLSTVIDFDVRRAVTNYCKRNGLKLRFVVEQALLEKLEDEIDLEAFRQRKDEATIPLKEVLAGKNKGRSVRTR